jgi:hypothetical protein
VTVRSRLIASTLATVAVAATAAPAVASTDFGTCSADLTACDADTDDCCYRAFDPVASDRAILIPLDRCHQAVASNGKYGAPSVTAPAWCAEPSAYSANDEGMYEAYGLVYRLMQAGIPVHWIINPTKDPAAITLSQNASSQTYTARDVDLWALSPQATPPTGSGGLATCTGTCVDPVKRLDGRTLAPIDNSYNRTAFPVRGSAFVIAAEDRPRFNEFWRKQGAFGHLAGNSNYDFSAVDLYELQSGASLVYQDYRTTAPSYGYGGGGGGAPVAVRIDYAPPRLARLAPAGVSEIWLDMAKLKVPASYPGCLSGAFSPADAVYCDVNLADIGAGNLVQGDFDWVWIDNWSDNTPCGTAAELDQVEELERFMTHEAGVRAGGHAIYMESVIGVLEGCAGHEVMGKVGTGLTPLNQSPSEPFILRRPHNVFMQWGDLPTSFAQGTVTRWTYWGSGAAGYEPSHSTTTGTLVRLASEDHAGPGNALCSYHRSSPACDVFANSASADNVDIAAYLRFRDDPANGVAFYMGGNQVNNGPSQLRMVLNTLIAMPLATVPQLTTTETFEVSRSSPIVATVDGELTQYQGSYTLVVPPPVIPIYDGTATDATFEFPYTKGNYRGISVDSGQVVWNAADHIPPANENGCGTWFTAGCRTIFTNLAGGTRPERVFLSRANRSSIGPLVASSLTGAEQEILISRILAGDYVNGSYRSALGGIDRSTAAIIEASPLTGAVRPTIAYVGATDGMLHAFCVDTIPPCATPGQELWAFAPRVVLPRMRFNEARIDGSPKVAEVFGDFTGNGRKEWRTVLTFQLGSGEPGVTGRQPAVYALDVTSPSNPTILWETATPAVRSDFELGVGVGLAMGPVKVGGATRNYTFVQTNNGGTGEPGIYLAAIDTETGTPAWSWTRDYPLARDAANPDVPASGIPGGVAAVDMAGGGSVTDVVVPTLYGDLWLIDAATGRNKHGTWPLFEFATDFHPIGAPPTIFRDRTTGQLHAAVVSGGYVDPISTSWSPAQYHQYAVAVALEAATTPVRDTGVSASRLWSIDLGAGQRAFGQAVVDGNEIYVVTDRVDVNDSLYGAEPDTGQLTRLSLTDGRPISSPVALRSGAASVDARAGVVHSGHDDVIVTNDFSSTFDDSGSTAELVFVAQTGRSLWLRLE